MTLLPLTNLIFFKWGVTPLTDNRPDQKYYYQVTIETGMRPGSGTGSKVGLIVSGDLFDTGVRMLDDNKREVSGKCLFFVKVSEQVTFVT